MIAPFAIAAARVHGCKVPRIAWAAARLAGIGYALLLAVLDQESGGGTNEFGHDPTIFAGAGTVTRARVPRLQGRARPHRADAGRGGDAAHLARLPRRRRRARRGAELAARLRQRRDRRAHPRREHPPRRPACTPASPPTTAQAPPPSATPTRSPEQRRPLARNPQPAAAAAGTTQGDEDPMLMSAPSITAAQIKADVIFIGGEAVAWGVLSRPHRAGHRRDRRARPRGRPDALADAWIRHGRSKAAAVQLARARHQDGPWPPAA